MKSVSKIIVIFLCIPFGAVAQSNILNARTPEEIGKVTQEEKELDEDNYIAYGYVNDRDILWMKTVWERVDLNQRVNFPLLYPLDTIGVPKNRRSLYQVLVNALKTGQLEAYSDSYFTEKRSWDELQSTLRKVDTLEAGIAEYNAGMPVSQQYIDIREITAYDLKEFLIKGIWYFDKRQGELKYRILGLCPVVPDVNFIDEEAPDLVPLFWIWYPSARKFLHDAKVYTGTNDAYVVSFDHLLNSRRFEGEIYKYGNVYQDREIKDYINDNAMMQLLESQHIKQQILDFEQDMWQY